MRAAIHQLDAALADWRTGMADAAALAVAAATVLDAYAWDFELAARYPFFTPRPAVIAVVVAEANSTLCPGVGGGGPVENSITPPSSNVCNPVAIPFRKLCNP